MESILGYTFNDPNLLTVALTHTSVAKLASRESNESLEWLGDAVLGAIISAELIKQRGRLSPGRLTNARASLVNTASLAKLAVECGLGEKIHFHPEHGHLQTPSERVLCDVFEAVIGAIYVDGGQAAAEQAVLAQFSQRISAVETNKKPDDPKSALYHHCQTNRLSLSFQTRKKTSRSGEPAVFTATALINGQNKGSSDGPSKSAAEQNAAQLVLDAISREKAASKRSD